MIKSTIPLLYNARERISGMIEIEVVGWNVTDAGITYTIHDYVVDGNTRKLIGSPFERFRSWEQLNSINDYLEANNSYVGMTKKAMEFAKVKHGLLSDTMTKPVYGSVAANWVLKE